MFQLRVALRRLKRQPAFAAAAIGTLALGIAAPTALFAVVHATLLRPLPYPDASHIYTVRTTMTDGRFTIGLVGSEEMTGLQRGTSLVTAAAYTQRFNTTLLVGDTARAVTAVGASPGFFELFGLPMALGRAFAAGDFQPKLPVVPVVLSHGLWQTGFGSDPGIVGRPLQLADLRARVVGVADAAFDIPHDADLWFAQYSAQNASHAFDGYVRLKAGATPAAVGAELGPMWQALAAKYPDMEVNRVFVLRPLLGAIVGDLGPTALIAFAAAGLLLLLAMVNVGNLLLARGAAHARDAAVHAALGASRSRIAGLLVTESLLVSAGAAALGVPLVWAAIRGIVAVGGSAFPRVAGLRLDAPALLFAAGVMIAAGVVVGLLPAVVMSRTDLASLTNESGRGATGSRRARRLLSVMIVSEVALAVALVAGAGRLVLSVRNLLAIDPGFATEGRLVADVLLPPDMDLEREVAWSQDVEAPLRALGATHVGMASSLPLGHEWDSTAFVDITGRPTDPAHRPNGRLRTVNPDFLEALHIPIVAGRNFTAGDRPDTEPVVLVSQSWARMFLPGLDPLRERVNPRRFFRHENGKWSVLDAAIVGVVADVHWTGLTRDPEPVVYLSSAQVPSIRRSLVVTTADGHPERLTPQIRAALRAVDPRVPVDFGTLAQGVSTALVWPRLGVLLMGTFGTVALVLAGAGVFGVIAYVVAQRAGEMAVRLALGATRPQVFGLVLGQGWWLAAEGAALGGLIAWWTGGLMSRYVYGVGAASLTVLGGSVAVVLAVALGAILPSARRAARVEPSRTLRT